VRTKETKQRKSAGCTFWAIPKVVSAEQKELAPLKQLFVLYAPTTSSISRPKSEAGSLMQHCFARCSGCFLFLIRFAFGTTLLCSLQWMFPFRIALLSVGYFALLVAVDAFENIHLNERSNVKSRGPAFSGGA